MPIRARRARAASCGLAFNELGGPLVAVCGLVGGSGASTLALCLARQAARESQAPVLLTESDSRRGGLAVLAGQATPLSLSGLAQLVADGQAPAEVFVEIEPGLRLVASAPARSADPDPEDLSALIREARAAHGLVIVDLGSAWATAGPVLDAATHILWTVTASRPAVARARLLAASDALPTPGRWYEVLIALAGERRPSASVRTLRRLATHRCERLVLAPHSDAVSRGDLADPSADLGRTLTGIAHVLRRTR
ncbi:MAG: hypothetical protein ACRDPC_00055 [Solirubrobacteraceae bacterium]